MTDLYNLAVALSLLNKFCFAVMITALFCLLRVDRTFFLKTTNHFRYRNHRFRNDPAWVCSTDGCERRLGQTTRFHDEALAEEPDMELVAPIAARCWSWPWTRSRVVHRWFGGRPRWTCPRCESSSLLLLPRIRLRSVRGARTRQQETWALAATRGLGLRWPWPARCRAWSSSRTKLLPHDEANRQPCCPMPARRNPRNPVWSRTMETTTWRCNVHVIEFLWNVIMVE